MDERNNRGLRSFFAGVISFILSGLIFYLFFSSAIKISSDSIFGSVYDHANPEVRSKKINEIRSICHLLENKEKSGIEIISIGDLNLNDFSEICGKNLDDRSFFVELCNKRVGNLENIILINFPSYSIFSNETYRFWALLFSLILTFSLFLVEGNFIEFLKNFGKLLIFVSLFGIFIYFLPSILESIIKVDTTFIFEDNENSEMVMDSTEIFLILLPIVLANMFTVKLFYYSIAIFGIGVTILVFALVKNKLITKRTNNTEKGPLGP